MSDKKENETQTLCTKHCAKIHTEIFLGQKYFFFMQKHDCLLIEIKKQWNFCFPICSTYGSELLFPCQLGPIFSPKRMLSNTSKRTVIAHLRQRAPA
jgi:hypothetical protein